MPQSTTINLAAECFGRDPETHGSSSPTSIQGCLRQFGWVVLALSISWCSVLSHAQTTLPEAPQPEKNQIKVNWLYGSYVPKEVPLEPMNRDLRGKLYIRQSYTTWGIYIKTLFFSTSDQVTGAYPEWGRGFDGYMKRVGTRHAEFLVQNGVIALGDGLLGWEPRYDRCRCTGLWRRTGHAIVRNFVTYDSTETLLRPQLLPYLGAYTGSVVATTWQPGKPNRQVKGYQAVITQIPVGMGVNWIGEFAPEIGRALHMKHKTSKTTGTR